MAALTAGKIAEVMFEEVMETIEDQQMLLNLVDRFEPDAENMMNADNFLWRPVEQQVMTTPGWVMDESKASGIIEETYPSVLGEPENDFVSMRADKMRDLEFWRRRGKRAAKQMGVEQNQSIANAIMVQGSLHHRQSVSNTSGFDFLAGPQRILNEQQRTTGDRHFLINDTANQKFAQELAGRQTLQGRPEEAWAKGQIGANVAEFDVHVASFLPTKPVEANATTTVLGDQVFRPESGSVNPVSGAVTNIDYRTATIPVAAAAGFNPGDKIMFSNGPDEVKAIGASTRTVTPSARTFAVVDVNTGTNEISIYPKPIALNSGVLLTTNEKAYSNVNDLIMDGADVTILNKTENGASQANIFFDKEAVEVISGTIPAQLFSEYNGHKVISSTMKNGHPMYMIYDANMINMQFRYRLFSWWGVTVKDPSRCGVAELYG